MLVSDPLVSIVVCTKGFSGNLVKCINSLLHIKYPNYEVVVVDSSTTDNSVQRVQELCSSSNVKYVREAKLGLSVARNIGIKFSAGDIIAFIDDDCIVEQTWLQNIVKNFNDLTVGCVFGSVVCLRGQEIYKEYLGFSLGSKRVEYVKSDYSVSYLFRYIIHRLKDKLRGGNHMSRTSILPVGRGANMAFRKIVFNKIGFFNEKLGLNAPGKAGEDIDIMLRILSAKFKIIYEPNAVVYHEHQVLSRNSLFRLVHDYYFGKGCALSLFAKRIGDLHDLIILAFLILGKLGLLYYPFVHKADTQRTIYINELRGFFSGLLRGIRFSY